jgi:hypothetical protein
VLEIDVDGVGAAAHPGIQGVDRGKLVGGELEVEDVEVLGDAFRPNRLGIADRPCCTCQRSITWAAVFPCA